MGCAWYSVEACSRPTISSIGLDPSVCSSDGGDASAFIDATASVDGGGAAYCQFVSTLDAQNALGVPDITSAVVSGSTSTLVSCTYSSPEVTSGPVLGITYIFGEPASIAEPLVVKGLVDKGWSVTGSSPVGTGGDVVTAPVAANGATTTSLIVESGEFFFQITSTSSLDDEVKLANEILSKL